MKSNLVSICKILTVDLSGRINEVKLYRIIIWQGKSERSDWFFLGRDFAIRTVSFETVISCVFFVFESRQIQNKHGPSAI